MNGTATTISAIPGAILLILICLVAYHWVESGESFTTVIKMTVQDVKVSFSCREVDIAARFIGRRYEDYLDDRKFFQLPGWKHLVCPIYAIEAVRTAEHRNKAVSNAWNNRLTQRQKDRIQQYAETHNKTVFELLFTPQ